MRLEPYGVSLTSISKCRMRQAHPFLIIAVAARRLLASRCNSHTRETRDCKFLCIAGQPFTAFSSCIRKIHAESVRQAELPGDWGL